MKNKAGFELVTCGRCAGSGKFSFNLMHGDRCYGCGGSGFKLSKRGAVAKAHMESLQARQVQDIKPGEFIWMDPSVGGPKRWCTVNAIVPDEWNPGVLKLELFRKGALVCTYHMHGISFVQSVRDEAERLATLAEALELQDTLNEKGKPLKRLSAALAKKKQAEIAQDPA